MHSRANESGMITAFAVVFVMALLLFAGLVFDGGMILAAKRQAIDEAQSAARAGAESLDVAAYRSSGTLAVDNSAATTAAQAYLNQAGAQGSVSVSGDQVQVVVSKEQPMRILGIAGLFDAHVSGAGLAHLERG